MINFSNSQHVLSFCMFMKFIFTPTLKKNHVKVKCILRRYKKGQIVVGSLKIARFGWWLSDTLVRQETEFDGTKLNSQKAEMGLEDRITFKECL